MTKTILFCSYHNYGDVSSGAAISIRALLRRLARSGWRARVLCGNVFDSGAPSAQEFANDLRRQNLAPKSWERSLEIDRLSFDFHEIQFDDEGVEVSAVFYQPALNSRGSALTRQAGDLLLRRLVEENEMVRPNVYLTYGGFWNALPAALYMRRISVKTVFYLCNLSYRSSDLFHAFDGVIVPSEFTREYYHKTLGIDSTVISPLIDERRVIATKRSPQYLTMVNPSYDKGLTIFRKIQEELGKRRPDIPILIVQGRAPLAELVGNIKPAAGQSVHFLRRTSDPTDYYALTRVLLVPTLCEETFGRVVVEAGWNRIPSIGTTRGSLRETIANGGYVFDVANNTAPPYNSPMLSTEVNQWLDAITRLWDDEEYYQTLADAAYRNATQYSEKIIGERFLDFFERLAGDARLRRV